MLKILRSRSGVTNPNKDVPCYYPQFDTTYLPFEYELDLDNDLHPNNSESELLKYAIHSSHEQGHRQNNYSCIVGYIYLSFTILKIQELLFEFPEHKDKEKALQTLIQLDERENLLFNTSHIWDELLGLIHTSAAFSIFKISEHLPNYLKSTFLKYPKISETYSKIMYIIDRISFTSYKMRNSFINTLIDTASSIDYLYYLDSSIELEEKQYNIDYRLNFVINFFYDICKEQILNIDDASEKLFEFLKKSDIEITTFSEEPKYNKFLYFMLNEKITADILKPFFHTIYRELTFDTNILKNSQTEIELNGTFPLSRLTMRKNKDTYINIGITNKINKYFYYSELFSSKLKIDRGKCFFDLFELGIIPSIVLFKKNNPKFVLEEAYYNTELIECCYNALFNDTDPKRIYDYLKFSSISLDS